MFALRALDGAVCALSQTEKTGTRPMGPSDLTGENGEGPIAPAVPFEPVGMDKHGIGDAAPFAHKPRAGRQRNLAALHWRSDQRRGRSGSDHHRATSLDRRPPIIS